MRIVVRLLVGLVLAAVVIAIPLLIVQHQDCRQGGELEDVWTVAVPFQAERRPRCRPPESAAVQLLEVVGLR